MRDIWFWQRIVSPHMALLALALVKEGCHVTYVAERPMSVDREAQGWKVPPLPGVQLHYVANSTDVFSLVSKAPKYATHLCQGIRANGGVGIVQRELARCGCSFWVVMEMMDDPGLAGAAKRLLYRALFARRRKHLHGILAIGKETPQWVAGRGVSSEQIFPFTYFLEEVGANKHLSPLPDGVFRFLFVGQFIPRKRLDLLIDALGELGEELPEFRLQIIGSGPLENELRAKGERLLGRKLEWLGRQTMKEVHAHMAWADCLVLPSRHDGWGAVVSEALMAGTPAICSDHCGAAEVVLASKTGGVFPRGDQKALAALLTQCLSKGRYTEAARSNLAQWATSLGATHGANYLMEIFSYLECGGVRPLAPWNQSKTQNEGAK
ncbi:MAG: hypothetical protein H6R15_1209 [Proteobacteria bacterium]|nr:hypothetical protein [Pseudomonadota bacterium]